MVLEVFQFIQVDLLLSPYGQSNNVIRRPTLGCYCRKTMIPTRVFMRLCYINGGFLFIYRIQVDEMSECQKISDIWTLVKGSGRKE